MTPRNRTSVITPYALTAVFLPDVRPVRPATNLTTLMTSKTDHTSNRRTPFICEFVANFDAGYLAFSDTNPRKRA